MFARFRNLFGKAQAEDLPIIVVDEAPPEEAKTSNNQAPLASEEEDLSNGHGEALSASTQELSQLLDELNRSSNIPDLSSEHDEEDDEDDESASTSSVKTKIAKASIERDIIIEDPLIEEESDVEEETNQEQPALHSLAKIKALIRNDSETYPQSDYTDEADENNTSSHSRTASQDSTAENNPIIFSCDYSIVPDDELPLDTSPSPMHSESTNVESSSSTTTTVTPTGNNELACAAISHKLSAIAEVAESLDAVIRDCSNSSAELDLSNVQPPKKLGLQGAGSEDWLSRSTEDESFATASEGNFTPNSHSSSFQTASGRTSSYIGSAKNSFDEADDSTLSNFEIPELPQSPVNMSFDSSELSYFSAAAATATTSQQRRPLPPNDDDDDQDSVVGVAELHSQSVTPTPEEQHHNHLLLAHPIESDSELEAYGLDAIGISTELMPRVSTANTPEVSLPGCAATASASNHNNNNNNNAQHTTSMTSTSTSTSTPASWRRSKYYENITKQTIKGFL